MTKTNTRRGFTQKTVMLNSFQHLHFNQPSFKAEEILNQVQDDNRRGFTLIELLVVVLIIGILSAVAVPQYQKAVWKSRISEALPLLKAIGNAEKTYFLANGKYTLNFNDLDIIVGEEKGHVETQYSPNWVFKLYELIEYSIYAQSRVVSGLYIYYYLDKDTLHCCFKSNDEKAKQICSGFANGTEAQLCATDPGLKCYSIN